MHWDGWDAVTPASKHLLDADTRFPKLVKVAARAIKRVIARGEIKTFSIGRRTLITEEEIKRFVREKSEG